ncbi:MAG: signal peptidase I [Lachnospiraceae bacterium]|nr:signal peptidase I [Lachnospiraceae bacterium]
MKTNEERNQEGEMNLSTKEEKEKAKNRDSRQEEQPGTKAVIWEYVRMIAGVVIVVLLLQNFVFINARIPSASMQNTVMVGDRVFGNRLAYTFGEPERYDIAIFRYPDDERKLFIKRVIGMPGDTVTIKADGIYINGSDTPLSEEFCPEQPDYTPWIGMSWQVPDDCYFMLGDNRNNSGDSRYWLNPFVEKDKVLAKAAVRYWPLNQISVLKGAEESYFEPEGAMEE